VERLINQLQQETLETRMVPVAEIFENYRRVVRDTAHSIKKEIDFQIDDQGISVDRLLIDKIKEPLVHMLRNAVDHAIEPPEGRRAAGKSPVGSVILRARREQGYAIIDVIDDGRGIDPAKIRSKALERAIVTAEELGQMTDSQVCYLICHPGFSTAEQVTTISGRGVGMDVVQKVIESVNGRLEISSAVGKGSRISLYLPMNLAIIQALLIRVCDEVYAIPLPDVLELVSFDSFQTRPIDKQPMFNLRGGVVPILDIRRSYGLDCDAGPAGIGYGVVLQTAKGKVALHVDEVLGRQEIVIKSLTKMLKDVKGFSNCTILGDGRVVLIMDVRGLL